MQSKPVREIAAIDLGSNSFHMTIARVVNGSIQVISRLKQKVRLAEGLDENSVLSEKAIRKGVHCLSLFAKRLQGFDPSDVNVVGTYTLRKAVNNCEFLAQAGEVFPYPINIISGEEEAKTIYAGVSHTQPEKGRKFVVDIGGGSTEMIIGDDFTPLIAQSRHMGCVSFAQKFFAHGIISQENFNLARQCAWDKIKDLAEEYCHLGWRSVLGSSGTIKTVYQVISATFDPNGIITPARLNQLIEQTLKAKHFSELNISGLPLERADVFVPGIAILSAIFDVFKIESMRYSNGALREGIISNLENTFNKVDVRTRTAKSLAQQFNLDLKQAERVEKSVISLANQYRQWQNPENIPRIKEMLRWAARLHEVGIVINNKGLQKHSAYILLNMELLGFDKDEQRLLSLLVRLHAGHFRLTEIMPFAGYDVQDLIAAVRLFRLATALNRPRQATELAQNIKLKMFRTLSNWELEFEPGYLNRNPLVWDELRTESNLLKELNFGFIFRDWEETF